MLAYALGRYPDKVCGHAVLCNSFRNPAHLAKMTASMQAFSGGKVVLGIGAGTRTALMLTPGLDFFAMFFALFKVGAVPVLIDPGIGVKPLKQCLEEAEPKAFIGVTKAHLARKILGWAKKSCKLLVTAGPGLGLGGITLKKLKELGLQ